MSITISTGHTVHPLEAIRLYTAVQWGKESEYSEGSMSRALDRTSFIVSARNETGELVGLLRAFSDGEITTHIADIVVHPSFQKEGIGKAMMEKVREQYDQTGIFTESFEGQERFFERCGYKKRETMAVFSKKFQ